MVWTPRWSVLFPTPLSPEPTVLVGLGVGWTAETHHYGGPRSVPDAYLTAGGLGDPADDLETQAAGLPGR